MAHYELKSPFDRAQIRAAALRLKSSYKACAVMVLNLVVLFVMINVGLIVANSIRNLVVRNSWSDEDIVTVKYGSEALDSVYPDMNRRKHELMLSEQSHEQFAYSDFNQFRSRAVSGKYLNVTDVGYRKSANQGPWPPTPENINVFVFGGSTTFGAGLPDHQTVPSFVQTALEAQTKRRVCVYNFGVRFYYSTQERISLEKLVMDGFVPDIACFIDGVNEGIHLENRPWFSREYELAVERATNSRFVVEAMISELPISKAARNVRSKLEPVKEQALEGQRWVEGESAVRVCETYLTNKYLIAQLCRRFGVVPVFVWQPSPAYKYDLKYHPFAPSDTLPDPMKYHYKVMRDYYPKMRAIAAERSEDNFLWCADIQEGAAESLYCDRYHYTAAFAKELAEYICDLCVERGLLDRIVSESTIGMTRRSTLQTALSAVDANPSR